jgi:hypothetical protein
VISGGILTFPGFSGTFGDVFSLFHGRIEVLEAVGSCCRELTHHKSALKFRSTLKVCESRVPNEGLFTAKSCCAPRSNHRLLRLKQWRPYVEQTVTQIHHNLTSLQMELPKILGYTWEGGYPAHDKPVMFMDALGRNVPIPFMFCISPNVHLPKY